MPRDAFIRTRTDAYLKEQAEAVFARLGINMTDAINMFLAQVILRSGLPFDVSIPASDQEFHQARQTGFDAWRKELNLALDEADSDFAAKRFLTSEQSRSRTRKKIEALQAERNRD